MRILLAEDNEPNRRVASALLRAAGYGLEVVGDGAKACERAATTDFDVVLMDVNMPNVDGIEATRRLRHDPRTRHLPIIGVSACAEDGERRRCMEAGMTDHIPKPVDWDRLFALLQGIEHALLGRRPAA